LAKGQGEILNAAVIEPEVTPMTLYHSLHSTCSQKVRLCLEEKGLSWRGHHLNLRKFEHLQDEFLALNPQGLVPVLIDQGRVLTESRIINEYLEDQYPQVALMPSDPYGKAQVRLWSHYIETGPSEAVKMPSFAKNIQPALAKMNRDDAIELIKRIPNRQIRDRWMLAATKGIGQQDLLPSLQILEDMVSRMNHALSHQQWLCGDQLTLADIEIAPFVQRLVRIDLFHWVQSHPPVLDWFHRINSRNAYQSAMPQAGSEGQMPPNE